MTTHLSRVKVEEAPQSRRTRRAKLWMGAIALLLVGIPAVRSQMGGAAEETTAETTQAERILPVETLTVESTDSYEVLRTYTGEIAALQSSELGFERSGQLVEITADEGDTVQAGTPLARLDTRNLQTQRQRLLAERARAQAQLAELQAGPRREDIAAAEAAVRDLEQQLSLQEVKETRREFLYDEGAISREELDEFSFGAGALQARLDQARSRLRELQNGTRQEQIAAQVAVVEQINAQIADVEVNLSKSTLRSPYSGVIALQQADVGTVVAAGQPVLRLVENESPEVRVGMPVSAVEQLSLGELRTVRIGSETYDAVVRAILPEVDPQTRTQIVVLALESAATAANSGQTVRVDLSESIPADGVWLPTEALTQGIRGLWTCYVLTKPEETPEETPEGVYTVQPQTVEIVHQQGDRVLVRGTLQPGDRIIATGTHRLVPGQLVRPTHEISQQPIAN